MTKSSLSRTAQDHFQCDKSAGLCYKGHLLERTSTLWTKLVKKMFAPRFIFLRATLQCLFFMPCYKIYMVVATCVTTCVLGIFLCISSGESVSPLIWQEKKERGGDKERRPGRGGMIQRGDGKGKARKKNGWRTMQTTHLISRKKDNGKSRREHPLAYSPQH